MDKIARTAITNAKSRAIVREPWYGVIASRFILSESADIDTIGVRIMQLGKIECVYSPEFVKKISLEQLIAVLMHEIEHVLRTHMVRFKRFKKGVQHTVWNIAADWVINGTLENKRIKNLPDEGCFIPTTSNPGPWANCDISSLNHNNTTEEFVDWIFENTDYKEIYIGSGEGEGEGEGDNGKGGKGGKGGKIGVLSDKKGQVIDITQLGDHKVWEKSEASADEMKKTAKNLARAANQSVGVGKTPGHLVEILKELEKAQHNWEYILRNISGRAAGGKRRTYGKRHRKKDEFGIKGVSKRNNVKLVLGVDISGSMSTKMLQRVFAEIERMMSKFKITLITFDTIVRSVGEYHKGDWKKIKLTGRGGTDFTAYFDHIENNGLVGKCNIILTDGYDTIPPRRDYHVVWAIVGKSGKEYVEKQDIWGDIVLIEHDYDNDRW